MTTRDYIRRYKHYMLSVVSLHYNGSAHAWTVYSRKNRSMKALREWSLHWKGHQSCIWVLISLSEIRKESLMICRLCTVMSCHMMSVLSLINLYCSLLLVYKIQGGGSGLWGEILLIRRGIFYYVWMAFAWNDISLVSRSFLLRRCPAFLPRPCLAHREIHCPTLNPWQWNKFLFAPFDINFNTMVHKGRDHVDIPVKQM